VLASLAVLDTTKRQQPKASIFALGPPKGADTLMVREVARSDNPAPELLLRVLSSWGHPRIVGLTVTTLSQAYTFST
jgi:hypothetical protein